MAFPSMLYRPGKTLVWSGLPLDSLTVHSEEEEAAARKDGWRDTAELLKAPAKPADPLDHDGDGKKGGSEKGEAATAHKGAAKRKAG